MESPKKKRKVASNQKFLAEYAVGFSRYVLTAAQKEKYSSYSSTASPGYGNYSYGQQSATGYSQPQAATGYGQSATTYQQPASGWSQPQASAPSAQTAWYGQTTDQYTQPPAQSTQPQQPTSYPQSTGYQQAASNAVSYGSTAQQPTSYSQPSVAQPQQQQGSYAGYSQPYQQPAQQMPPQQSSQPQQQQMQQSSYGGPPHSHYNQGSGNQHGSQGPPSGKYGVIKLRYSSNHWVYFFGGFFSSPIIITEVIGMSGSGGSSGSSGGGGRYDGGGSGGYGSGKQNYKGMHKMISVHKEGIILGWLSLDSRNEMMHVIDVDEGIMLEEFKSNPVTG
ncbi:hypothetical protein GQR58_019050 [Nymphon striatum]|nr:hypothetical protein GQR58_019050 [Nymphon striatum]